MDFHGGPVTVLRPARLTAPLVFASPHSGRDYPLDFLQDAALTLTQLRRSEDAYVDELFSSAPVHGAPLVLANFPRVFLDPNRSPDELDPRLLSETCDDLATASPKTRAGLGIIPRLGAEGQPVYARRPSLADAQARISALYRPYHQALEAELAAAEARFGLALLIDAHSMPSRGQRDVDIVLGDRHGVSAAAHIVDRVEAAARNAGFRTARNIPYAGGHSTEHYGRPLLRRHAVQIEVNRALYLDEAEVTRSGTFDAARDRLTAFIADLCGHDWTAQTA